MPVNRSVTRTQRKSVSNKSRSLRHQDSHLLDEETSESECEIRPLFKWRSEHDDSRAHVAQRNRDNVLPVVDKLRV